MITDRQFNRDVDRWQRDMKVVSEKLAPGVQVQAANKVLASARTVLTKHMVGATPNEVKAKHIRPRITLWRASLKKHKIPVAEMSAYITDMPAISLGTVKGGASTKGEIIRGNRDSKGEQRGGVGRTKSGRKRRNAPKHGGVKVGGKTFEGAFLQKANGKWHIFRRRQFRTWEEGSWGWPKPDNPRKRAKFDLLKYKLRKPFRRYVSKSMQESYDKNFQKYYDAAYTNALAKLQVGRGSRR